MRSSLVSFLNRPSLVLDAALGVFVAVVHLTAALVLEPRIGALYEDGHDFHVLATGLAQGQGYGPPQAVRPPGWPTALSLPYRLFGANPIVGLCFTAILAGLTVVVLVQLGRRLGLPPGLSRAAALGYGLFPWVLVIGSSLYAETLFNLLTVGLCLLMVTFAAREPMAWWWMLPGLIAGSATLVRPVLAAWLPVGVLLVLGRRLRWKPAVAMAVGIGIVMGPWAVRNYERLDAFVPLTTAGGITLALANNDLAGAAQVREGLPHDVPTGEVESDREYQRFAVAWIQKHPGEFAARVPQRLIRTFDPVTRLNRGVFAPAPLRWTVRVLWIAVLFTIAVGLARHHRGPWLVPLSLVVAMTAQVCVFGGGFRFLIPSLPFLALWSAAGIAAILRRAAPHFSATIASSSNPGSTLSRSD